MPIIQPLLQVGDEFHVRETGAPGKVTGEIGEGGQGQVYRCLLGDGSEKALKVYHRHYFQQNSWLANKVPALVARRAPSDRFLWPEATARFRKDRALFGYIMPLKPGEYLDAVSFLAGQHISYRHLLRAASQVAEAFKALHSRGLCYRDINWNNVAIDPKSGNTKIVDNDNVDFDSDECQIAIGMPPFIAPEVLSGEDRPSSDSDRHSLAVLFYFLFFQHHPLDGKAVLDYDIWGAEDQHNHYKSAPYHFDPVDRSNEAIPSSEDDPEGHAGARALHHRAKYPKWFLKNFDETFTRGLRSKHLRIMEDRWIDDFDHLGHQILHCSNRQCIAGENPLENFYRGEELHRCRNCSGEIVLPPRIRVTQDHKVYVLSHDVQLRGRHIGNPDHPTRRDEVHARIEIHPENPSLWGLRNETNDVWKVQSQRDGPWVDVEPGKRVRLERSRIQIDFRNGRKAIVRCGAPRAEQRSPSPEDSE